MSKATPASLEHGRPSRKSAAALLALSVLAAGCATSNVLPPPRPLVVSSGARLNADPVRLEGIYDWVLPQIQAIREDPTFWIVEVPSDQDSYPWETLVLQADTARYQRTRTNPDIVDPYNIYAHLHLMRSKNRLGEWMPDEVASSQGYALERAIVERMADAWLLGRSTFDTQPHPLLDELIYAREAGHLDAFLFTARPEDFQSEREAWLQQNPQALERYHAWFRQTLGGDPPGVRAARNGVASQRRF